MNKILIIALAIILAITSLVPSVNEAGPISLEAFGYIITTNTLVASSIIIVLLLLFKVFIAVPRTCNYYYHKLFSKDAFALLADYCIAISTNNAKTSLDLLHKIERLTPKPALLNLLKIQTQKISNSTNLQLTLEKALCYPEIAPIALKELIDLYLAQGQLHKANEAADQLWLLQHSQWLFSRKISLLFKLEIWPEVVDLTEQAMKFKLISKNIANQLKAVAFYKSAELLQHTDQTKSLSLLNNAYEIFPSFVPSTILLLEIELIKHDYKSFIRHAQRAWDIEQNDALASQIAKLANHISPAEFLEACRNITKTHKGNYESLLLMAGALILVDDLDNADKLLNQALSQQKEPRVYLLLARCHHKMHASIAQIYGWLDQACAAYSKTPSSALYPKDVMTLLETAERKPLEQ